MTNRGHYKTKLRTKISLKGKPRSQQNICLQQLDSIVYRYHAIVLIKPVFRECV